MSPDGARRLLVYLQQQDAEAVLLFDLARLGPASEHFDHTWPRLSEWPWPPPEARELCGGN